MWTLPSSSISISSVSSISTSSSSSSPSITSAEATTETFEKHKKLKVRADDYLLKPFDAEQRTERDDERVTAALAARLKELRVEDAMVRELIRVGPDEPLQKVAQAMLEKRVHRLLVMDGERVVPGDYCTQAMGRDGGMLMMPETDRVRQWLQQGASLLLNDIDQLTPGIKSAAAALRSITCWAISESRMPPGEPRKRPAIRQAGQSLPTPRMAISSWPSAPQRQHTPVTGWLTAWTTGLR